MAKIFFKLWLKNLLLASKNGSFKYLNEYFKFEKSG